MTRYVMSKRTYRSTSMSNKNRSGHLTEHMEALRMDAALTEYANFIVTEAP